MHWFHLLGIYQDFIWVSVELHPRVYDPWFSPSKGVFLGYPPLTQPMWFLLARKKTWLSEGVNTPGWRWIAQIPLTIFENKVLVLWLHAGHVSTSHCLVDEFPHSTTTLSNENTSYTKPASLCFFAEQTILLAPLWFLKIRSIPTILQVQNHTPTREPPNPAVNFLFDS